MGYVKVKTKLGIARTGAKGKIKTSCQKPAADSFDITSAEIDWLVSKLPQIEMKPQFFQEIGRPSRWWTTGRYLPQYDEGSFKNQRKSLELFAELKGFHELDADAEVTSEQTQSPPQWMQSHNTATIFSSGLVWTVLTFDGDGTLSKKISFPDLFQGAFHYDADLNYFYEVFCSRSAFKSETQLLSFKSRSGANYSFVMREIV